MRATTRVVGVIGDPVRHSLSPVLHNTAFRELGIDWVYVAFPVERGRGAEAVAAVRALGIEGISVTMPHKEDVIGGLDRLTPVAGALRSVNTVFRDGAELVGDSTDGQGFVASLRHDLGWDPAGRTCLVIGTGGAARAVSLALRHAGGEVSVLGRNPESAGRTASLTGAGLAKPEDLPGADLVVNATPAGMSGDPSTLPVGVGPDSFRSGQVVADLVYVPLHTPLLELALRSGARTLNGLGMLVHQAALQLERWTGLQAPVETMLGAADQAIRRRD